MPIVNAQILGTSEEYDTHPSLIVSVDELRLLFNAGEGIQRLANEHGVKLSKINHMFLTSLTWNVWGGAPDLLFYFSDTGKKGINIYGPTSIVDFIMINHYYFWKPDFLVGVHQIANDSVLNYPSKGVFVKPILITPKSFTPAPISRVLNPCYDDVMALDKQTEEEEALGASDSHDSHAADDDNDHQSEEQVREIDKGVVCYCVHTPEIAGKFDMAAATKLGVPKGPLCGKLVKGETIELPNGKKVSPEDCVGPATHGPIIMVVTCPSTDYVECLTTHPSFDSYITDSKNGRIIYVFHITPDEVIASEPYQSWVKKFGAKTHHVAMFRPLTTKKSKEGEAADSFVSSNKHSLTLQMQLHKIDPNFFPLPHQVATDANPLPPPFIRADFMLKTILQPIANLGWDKSEIPTAAKLSEIKITPELQRLLNDYHTKKIEAASDPNVPEYLKNLTSEEAEIVFLGTGAAIPFKLRSVTSIFVNFFESGGLLLDAGESAYTQLCRKYGAKIDEILLNLKCVWISHKHADHHLSLPSILSHRREAFIRANKQCPPLTIFGPFYTSGYLTELSWFHPLNFRVIHNSEIKTPQNKHSEFFRETFGLNSFYNIRVPHIVDSYGLIFQSMNGWKLVFSGDTSPCEKLAEEGKGATVVIHEATMENALQHEAAGRGHSSTRDAIDIGNKMGCYRTILTHFSARHHHVPVPDFVDKPLSNASVAFDLMTVNLKDLPHLPLIITPLVQMYKEDLSTSSK